MVLETDVCWISASELVSLVISCKAVINLALVVASPVERESTFGCNERCHRGAITGIGRGQVGNGVNIVLFIDVIGRLKSSIGCGYERLAIFLTGGGKVALKAWPGLGLRCLAHPDFTVVGKQPCLEKELESDDYDLIRRVGCVASCRIFDGSFYLIIECFGGVVGAVGVRSFVSLS